MTTRPRLAFCKCLTAILPVVLLSLRAFAAAGALDIPALTWTQRSDWVNVKEAPYNAKGDGEADDTAAIQAALSAASVGHNSNRTVYLPPGKYKITQSLDWQGTNRPWAHGGLGLALIGCGRDTVIQWFGESGKAMFFTKGGNRTRYVGLAWDGRNIASCAYEAASPVVYESRVRHENESFRNFTTPGTYLEGETLPAAAIIGGLSLEKNSPDAEVLIFNCLFANCSNGLVVGHDRYNNYQWEIKGCEFESCGVGVACGDGKTVILDDHFQSSSVADITTGAGLDQTIRRCTSVGSKTFFTIGQGGSSTPQVVQDCWIDGWTGKNGAIQIGSRGPVLVYDSTFTSPPSDKPPIVFNNAAGCPSRLLLSGCYAPGSAKLVEPGPASTTVTVPCGTRGGDVTALSSPETTFLRTTWPADGAHILDVTQPPFNAKADGVTDSTAAIQAAIDAARVAHDGSIVYLPARDKSYLIKSMLRAGGSNYTIQGSGLASCIAWGGPESGDGAVMFAVPDAQHVSFEQFLTRCGRTVTAVLQTGLSSTNYDGFYGWGPGNSYNEEGPGLLLSNLPAGAVVNMPHLDAALTVDDSGPAEILCNFACDGRLIVKGAKQPKSGFFGILNFQGGERVDEANHWDVVVDDNQDLVIGHYYQEQGYNHLLCSRGAGTSPGRVTIDGVKQHQNNTADTAILIDNYAGLVMYGPQHFANLAPTNITQKGSNPVDLVLPADVFSTAAPNLNLGPSCRLIQTQNVYFAKPVSYPDEVMSDGALRAIAAGLDQERQLGWEDLRLNYGIENVVANGSFEGDAPNAKAETELGGIPASWEVKGAVAGGSGVRSAAVVAEGSPFGPGAQSLLLLDSTGLTTGEPLQVIGNTLPLGASAGAVLTVDFRVNKPFDAKTDVWIGVLAGSEAACALHLAGDVKNCVLSGKIGGQLKKLARLEEHQWYRLRAVLLAPAAGKQNVRLYLSNWQTGGPKTVALENGGVIDGLGAASSGGFTSVVFDQGRPGASMSLTVDNVMLTRGNPLK